MQTWILSLVWFVVSSKSRIIKYIIFQFLWFNFVAPNTKSVDPKINTQVWLSCMKKETTTTRQMKRKSMAQRTDTRRNLKRHISLVSL